jgi:hypothetical protein
MSREPIIDNFGDKSIEGYARCLPLGLTPAITPRWLAFRHIERQSDGILHSSLGSKATLARCAFALKFNAEKTCNQLDAMTRSRLRG